jgi:hypothetical protein
MQGPFAVTVTAYSTAAGEVGRDLAPVFVSRHRSAKAAARKLASLIAKRTKAAREVHRRIPMNAAGAFMIETADGRSFALNPFRRLIAQESKA